jgi:hypothetical protein
MTKRKIVESDYYRTPILINQFIVFNSEFSEIAIGITETSEKGGLEPFTHYLHMLSITPSKLKLQKHFLFHSAWPAGTLLPSYIPYTCCAAIIREGQFVKDVFVADMPSIGVRMKQFAVHELKQYILSELVIIIQEYINVEAKDYFLSS